MKMRKRRKLTRHVHFWALWVRRLGQAQREGCLKVTFHEPARKVISMPPGAVIYMGA